MRANFNRIAKHKQIQTERTTNRKKSTFRLISKHPSDIVYYAKGSSEWSVRPLHDDIPNRIYPSFFSVVRFFSLSLCVVIIIIFVLLFF